MKLFTPWRLVNHYLQHPLGRRQRALTLINIIRWQLGSSLLHSRAVAMPFVNRTRLMIKKGMTGATGNIYVGLVEFEDMAFVLHFLRAGDQFLDVGANVGVYTVLAASCGARVTSIEPVPESFEQLVDNINVNRFGDMVEPHNIGVGGERGELQFSTNTGPTNHVLAEDEHAEGAIKVAVEKLDSIAGDATMAKIDVEGFEHEVIEGAPLLLDNPNLKAILIELNGLAERYGYLDQDVHDRLVNYGFSPVQYNPFDRCLMTLPSRNTSGNTLYVRNIEDVETRLQNAPIISIGNVAF